METEATEDQRYLVEYTVLDTFTEVSHDGGMEPKVVGTGRILYCDTECVCDEVTDTIEHYQSHHLDDEGDYRE